MKIFKLSLLGILILSTIGCAKIKLEENIEILQEKEVVRIEIRDVGTGTGKIITLEDRKKIAEIIPRLKSPVDQALQMIHWLEITFYFADGRKAVGSFNCDPVHKKLYIGDWIFDDPELWSLFKEHFGIREDVKPLVIRRKDESEEDRKLHEILTRIVEIDHEMMKLTAEKRYLEKTLRELREEIKNKSNK